MVCTTTSSRRTASVCVTYTRPSSWETRTKWNGSRLSWGSTVGVSTVQQNPEFRPLTTRGRFLKKTLLSPVVVLCMEKTMVAKVIGEYKSISILKIFPESGAPGSKWSEFWGGVNSEMITWCVLIGHLINDLYSGLSWSGVPLYCQYFDRSSKVGKKKLLKE